MKLIIILTLLLTGCSSGSGGSESEPESCLGSIFYGDSIGVQLRDSPYAPDFVYDVIPGRKITDISILDNSYCNIYLELGTNLLFLAENIDIYESMDIEEAALIGLISGIEDKVICVTPMQTFGQQWHMRDMMIEHCHTVIDPESNGVYPNHPDSIHLYGNDNIKSYASLFIGLYQQ